MRRPLPRRTCAGLVLPVLASCALLVAARPAPAAWQTPEPLPTMPGELSAVHAAVDGGRGATALWEAAVVGGQEVWTVVRPPIGPWALPVRLSGAGVSVGGTTFAANALGAAVAAWEVAGGAQASVRPAGGSWEAPQDLRSGKDLLSSPDVAVDGSGRAMVVWAERATALSDRLVWFAERPAGGAWQPPVQLSRGGANGFIPAIASNADGDVIVAWYGSDRYVRAVTRSAGGSWSGIAQLSGATYSPYGVDAAIDLQGNATVVWAENAGSPQNVRSAAKPSDRGWGPAVDVSAGATGIEDLRVAAGPSGEAVAAWAAQVGATDRVLASSRPLGGAWQASSSVLSDIAVNATALSLAIDAQGTATAVWLRESRSIDASRRPAGGTWEPRTVLVGAADERGSAAVAPGPDGTALALWTGFGYLGLTGADFGARPVAPPTGGGSGTGVGAPRVAAKLVTRKLGKIRRAKALRVTCSLDRAGTCRVTATIGRGAAKRLGLRLPRKRTTPVRLGGGSVRLEEGRLRRTVRVRLSRAVRAALADVKALRVRLVVRGRAADGQTTVIVKRPLLVR